MPENHAAIWRDLSRLKAQADRKLLKFNSGNCLQGKEYPTSVHTEGQISRKQCFLAGLGTLVDNKLTMNWQLCT